jgi:hypothetical protein
VPYLLNTFASNAPSLTSKSKSSTAIINQTFFIRTTTIVQEKKTYQMNLTTNKQSSKKKGFNEHTFEKIQICKKHQYKMKA